MEKPGYAACEKVILVSEGGKVDNPKDPGGRTNQGVTQRVYSAWRGRQNLPRRDVYQMEPAERDAIYRAQYWTPIFGDALRPGVNLVVFDGAVNSGVSQAIKWLQRALGVPADGVMGEVTMHALEAVDDDDALIGRICERRLAFLRELKTWKTFGRGWGARVNQTRAIAQAWANGSVGAPLMVYPGMSMKALLGDANAPPPRAPADMTASGGAVSSGLATAQQTLAPLAGSAFVDHLVQGLIVLGVLLTLGGLVYGVYARRRKGEIEAALDLPPPETPAAAPPAGELEPV